ncbi:gamma-glutamyltransferase family protein [Hydrogenophaga sp.]|uniref:gamma-glutamyltransferase family protein n=1 Tax=Hydrogenophaga sp. TaxID=1904254 RepID=UPI0025BF7217|nr:gamma-glutamyltransferase family protein [Hydrogenophaga sp.]
MFTNWHNPYPVSRAPVMARNVVATTQPLAAQAGLRMLLKGGNAIDAAIATAAALTVVEPCSNGLGSDNFAIVWDGKRLQGMNSSGAAPAGWNPAYFRDKHGQIPLRGFDAVTVPGAVAGWVALSERFGSLPFADLLEPAIELAERGHAVAPVIAKKWSQAMPLLHDQPGFAEAFLPRGRTPVAGERFVFGAAGRALRAIAETRGEAFYRGDIAAAIEAYAREHGAQLRASDLAAHAVEWVDTISVPFAGHAVHELPPNGQGIAALMALGMLQALDIGQYDVDSVEGQHLQIEAIKLAFADTYRWVADPRFMTEVRAADLLNPDYLRERARLIDPVRAIDPGPGKPPMGGTVYLTTADAQGRMVSFIQSNYLGFGSGVVVPGWGISLHNRGHGFTLQDGHPNQVAPGKRPFHTIIPGFLTREGQPVMGFGVMGANMQPQGHVQTLVRMLVHGQQPQAASDAPRWKWGKGLDVDFEATMDPALLAGLKAKGHRFEPTADTYLDFGSGQFIARLSDDIEDGYVAASDSRRDGQAVGF